MNDPNDPIEPSRYDCDVGTYRVPDPEIERAAREIGWTPEEGGAAEWLVSRVRRVLLEAHGARLDERHEAKTAPLRAEVARLTRERDEAQAQTAQDVGRMQRVVYDALVDAVRRALPGANVSAIDGAGSDGDEFDFTAAEVSIACGILTDALAEARAERDRWQQVAVQNGVAAGRLGGDALSLQDAVRDASLERDAYRAFAVRIATALASPGAEDLAAKIRLGDLDRLAEMVEERLSDPLPEDDRALFARQREAIGLLAAERDRLALTLRCERGEWAPDAPEGAGWTWRPEDWEWTGVAGARSEDGEPTNLYVRHRAYWGDEDDQDDNAWTWLVVETIGMGDEGDALASGTAPTALEAIEACDAAIREVRGE